MVQERKTLDPRKFPGEWFDLLSIPAFDAGESELVVGSEIGSAKVVVSPGDVLLSRIVPHIRRAWVVPHKGEVRQVASSEWIVFRNPAADPNYLARLLVSDQFHAHYMNTVAGVGGSLLRARPKYASLIQVPLPPLEEQRRIAAILDEADELRKKRAESLTKLDTLKQSIFISMFGDLALNPMGWKETVVSEFVAGFETGVSLSLKDGEQAGSDSVLKISAVTSGRFLAGETKPVSKDWQAEHSHRVRQGDLLMSRANTTELVGATAYVFEDAPGCLLPDKLWRFVWQEPKRADPLFVSEAMKSRRVRQQIEDNATGSSGSMKNISQAKFLKTVMPCPPFELQAKFGQIVQQIEEQRFRGSCGFSELETLFASLQQEAFAGRL